ncbi:RNA polymerase sigma factor RpoE [Marinicella litoralis]|uniref:RNA polymerase sigma factor n=1 Tax=Marinicella litoralis TaxID=644220 RepID=A0A4R6XAW6_9GAMM|nr:RNA polymerase sigma factor RpoE [Marinicella litoralis]TDR16296.1 RNA polymerase RpoE-like sigma-24 subunit [Marinicella litoralis]
MKLTEEEKMSEKTLDAELVTQAQQGKMSAFELLVNRYQQRVANVISKFVKDRHEIQDVAQEVFIKVFRALPNFRGDSSFYTWIYRIAVNTSKNHLVSRSRRIQNTQVEFEDAESFNTNEDQRNLDTPDAVYARGELEQTMSKAISMLPEDLKAAIVLREVDGLSYDEIAVKMDCPIGTVRSRIFRARDAIDQALRPLLQDESKRKQNVR